MLFVTSSPLVFATPLVSQLVVPIVDDFAGFFSYFPEEQANVLDLIVAWKAAKKGRELTVIGGDVHQSSIAYVYKDGERQFMQLVTSPIANDVGADNLGENMLMLLQDNTRGYSFVHKDKQRHLNYGLITISSASKDSKAINNKHDESNHQNGGNFIEGNEAPPIVVTSIVYVPFGCSNASSSANKCKILQVSYQSDDSSGTVHVPNERRLLQAVVSVFAIVSVFVWYPLCSRLKKIFF